MTHPTDDKTSLTADERIEIIVPLPPPEHLIRFFPIQGTPVEQLISRTRLRVSAISCSTGVPWIGKKPIRCSGGGSGTVFSMRSASARGGLAAIGSAVVGSGGPQK